MKNRELADALGVHESTVSRLLSGDRNPGIEVMSRIKERFGWSLDDQWAALGEEDTYAEALRSYMERQPTEQPCDR